MKTVDVKTFAQRSIRAWMLAGLLGGGWAMAQEYAPDLRAALIASTESGKTIELKDGRVFSYRQLVELPESERVALSKSCKNRSEHASFRQWELATAEAEGRRLDKELAESSGRIARHMEALSAKSRKELVAGEKLTISFKSFSQFVTSIDDRVLKAGLSKESADFLKSLLHRPELFAQP